MGRIIIIIIISPIITSRCWRNRSTCRPKKWHWTLLRKIKVLIFVVKAKRSLSSTSIHKHR
jgi:hypothetical protein